MSENEKTNLETVARNMKLQSLNEGYVTQSHFADTITMYYNWYQQQIKDKKDLDLSELQTISEELVNAWREYQRGHSTLIRYLAGFNEADQLDIRQKRSYWRDNKYETTHQGFLNTSTELKRALKKLTMPIPTVQTIVNQAANNDLPMLDLPKFNGDYTLWLEFQELFTQLVINKEGLSDTCKFRYLIQALDKETINIISGIQVTGDHFQEAWAQLVDKYHNPRLLIDAELANLFSHPVPPAKLTSKALATIVSRVEHARTALEKLGEEVQYWDSAINYRIKIAVGTKIRNKWEKKIALKREKQPWADLRDFLVQEQRALELEEASSSSSNTKPSVSNTEKRIISTQSTVKIHQASTAQPGHKCPYCGLDHELLRCAKFRDIVPRKRTEFVKQRYDVCFNCLGAHQVVKCTNTTRCRNCNNKHHTMLCFVTPTPRASSSSVPSSPKPSGVVKQLTRDEEALRHHPVLLATALVNILDRWGRVTPVRALFDQGSEISLVTEEVATLLGLERKTSRLAVVGIGQGTTQSTRGCINFKIQSRVSLDYTRVVVALILPKLTGLLPSVSVKGQKWQQFNQLVFADPAFYKPAPIDAILGADVYSSILKDGVIRGNINRPLAQNTELGWILSGNFRVEKNHHHLSHTNKSYHQGVTCTQDNELYQLVKQFWYQEEHFPSEESSSLDQDVCIQQFLSSYKRDTTGRFIVRYPFKKEVNDFGNSFELAKRMLINQEKKMEKNPELHRAYHEFMKEYESLGHMTKASPVEMHSSCYYLPHHSIIKESSSSTKLRVVFNGSQVTNIGESLNDNLYEGPKLLNSLISVLTQWRSYRFAFSCDIKQMFRQIQIHQDDRKYQKILWRNSPDQSIEEYELTTVTYGTKPAPFLALATLRQLEREEKDKYPLVSNAISIGSYMDDIYLGADNIQEGIERVKQTRDMFNSGGFELRKWISNSADLLRDVPDEHREQSSLSSIEGDPLFRTLGLTWNIKEDCFCYTYSPYREPQTITKRVVLARVAQLFDPLGWITPIITRGKLLVQQLWRVKLEWDEEIPLDLLNQWREFNDQLNHLSSITIPRWLNLESSTSSIQIHGFGDASDAAVGAVVYLVVINSLGQAKSNIIAAKSKLAPIKTGSRGSNNTKVSTPRLELSAAVLLVKLVKDVQESLSLTSVETHLWTDSSITFYWIKGDASRWKTFIQNRVVLIQSTIPNAIWHHVPGEENPADVASRGVSSEQLTSDRLWWEGPHWICEDQSTWPVLGEIEIDTELVEERQIKIHTIRASEEEFLTKFSTLTKVVSSASWWRRFYQSFSKKHTINNTSWLTVDERRHALWGLILFTQQQQFHQEITTLSKGESISRSSTLIKLNPFIDRDGLLRVGSRLDNSSLQAEAVNPIILPKESRLTELILHECHVNTHHGGAQLMLATLRQNYWIVGGRVPVRSFINKCVTCVRHRAKQAQQLIGQLPPSRVLKMRPFLHTEVDYAGPFELKTWSGRGNKKYKAYLVVFVCMSSSAVHLELATDYTTEGFLAAFKRFISRRGSCTKLYSDCGTNFVGADAELKKLFTASSKGVKELASLLARDGTSWSFIPPGSPHFGGKWESVVKSSKHHIKRVIGDHVLTYEQFTTFLTQVECLLNSRPLCPLSDDPEDLQALTPGHFLIGEPLNLVPEPSVLEVPDNRLTSWKLLRKFLETFWDRWSREYLQKYLVRSKWMQTNPCIKEGTMALVIDERYPPGKWALARVIKVHPGDDGLVRAVTIKTQSSEYLRPIAKLCILPIEISSSSSAEN